MLVKTIAFEIHNFNTHTDESFMVANTTDNYEMIFTHKSTRQIKFAEVFDFEFARKCTTPKFLILGAAVADSFFENENVMDIDDVDEMVGTY